MHLPVHRSTDRCPVLFVTVNTRLKKPILAHDDVHELLRDTWALTDDWRVGWYVVMPEHLHFLCSPRGDRASLARWMSFWKGLVSRRWPRPGEQPIWQRDFWDTQLRRNESYEEKWEYMRMNPVRRALVNNPDDWPFAGRIHDLEW